MTIALHLIPVISNTSKSARKLQLLTLNLGLVYIWDPESQGSKPLKRLMGHTKQVNAVTFSNDGRLIATASWDNSVKVFDRLAYFLSSVGDNTLLMQLNREGTFLATLRGHVSRSGHHMWPIPVLSYSSWADIS